MDKNTSVRLRFPEVNWITLGGISFVYDVHPCIVVKVPKPEGEERERFQKELKILKVLSEHKPCPLIVQCFLYTENGIYLEYMRDGTLRRRLERNHVKDWQLHLVTEVKRLEPLPLRMEWMNKIAQAVAYLESLGLAHGDLRPDNILLDRDQLKLTDFDYTAKIGELVEVCSPPYGRRLDQEELDLGDWEPFDYLGPRTEQFSLGSMYYFINYGFEVYEDRNLHEDPNEKGPEIVKLLQKKIFPELTGNPQIDDIINKCWHGKYTTIADLAVSTQALVDESVNDGENTTTMDEAIKNDKANSQDATAEEFSSKKSYCEDLEKRGLSDLLASAAPVDLGFSLNYYQQSIYT